MKTKKANKVAIKRMKKAGKLLNNNQKDAFYDEVLQALWGYVSDKLNIPVSMLSKDNIEEKLKQYGVSDNLIKDFIEVLNRASLMIPAFLFGLSIGMQIKGRKWG